MTRTARTSARSVGARRLLREWAMPIAELTVRIGAILLAANLLFDLTQPLEGVCLSLAHALIVLGAVILLGVTLLNTLFYDHYRP